MSFITDIPVMSAIKDTLIRNPEQFGRAVHLKRQKQSLSQKTLAAPLALIVNG
jgi:hypothetical protein